MTMQYHEDVAGREFKDALLSVSELRAWLLQRGDEVETDPPLCETGFIQVEALLCAIERAAHGQYSEAYARAIVCRSETLSEHDMADVAPQWLIGAHRHAAWRDILRVAIERGELALRDPVTHLRVCLPTSTETNQPAGKGEAMEGRPIRAAESRLGDRWTPPQLQKLLAESNEPGITQVKLAKQYGITRQRVGALLKEAKAKFGQARKPSPFPKGADLSRKGMK